MFAGFSFAFPHVLDDVVSHFIGAEKNFQEKHLGEMDHCALIFHGILNEGQKIGEMN